MIGQADVTACLVTRGDQPAAMSRILESLIFENVIVWNNAARPSDWKTAGRYAAVREATTTAVYFQDDDVIVPPGTQAALLNAYEPGVMVANWAHGSTPAGYGDIPLVGAGAVVERELPWQALGRYLVEFPLDDAFLFEADYIAGTLYPASRQLHLPFTIDREVATHHSRLANQPWQRDLKASITQRARMLRDGVPVIA